MCQQVFVRNLAGRSIAYDVDGAASAGDLKELIQVSN